MSDAPQKDQYVAAVYYAMTTIATVGCVTKSLLDETLSALCMHAMIKALRAIFFRHLKFRMLLSGQTWNLKVPSNTVRSLTQRLCKAINDHCSQELFLF